jgi:hypothetical protein
MATGSNQQWFPNVSKDVTVGLQQIFQQVLQRVYANRTNIASLQAQVAAIPALSTNFPAHWNSLGAPPQQAYNPATGDQFLCYQTNKWVRTGPSGTSTSF